MKNKTNETYANTDETDQSNDEKSLFDKLKYKLGIIVVIIGIFTVVVALFTPCYTVRDDRLTLRGGGTQIFNLISLEQLRGGYQVHYSDIVNIELLPYSARQLEEIIEGLHVPSVTRERSMVIRYVGDFRLHVNFYDPHNRTIMINRHTGTPVLISLTNNRTPALYEELVAAFERWQVRR
jgi:hypothetical protein